MSERLVTGAPGIYTVQDARRPSLERVRMDVCAFVGIAPRGPAREPVLPETWPFDRPCVGPAFARRRSVAVAVESMDEYRRLFGGFDGPGRLPYAVASFFEQQGRRAYITRIVHEFGDGGSNAGGVARGALSGASATEGALELVARNEGTWGNDLRARLGYSVAPLAVYDGSVTSVHVDGNEDLPVGSLLRITYPGGSRVDRFVASTRRERTDGGEFLAATFDQPLVDVPEMVEVIEGILIIRDGTGSSERHERLGLSSTHRRWMATVLCYESDLVYPDASWIGGDVRPDSVNAPPLEPVIDERAAPQFEGGEDRYQDITSEDFFDSDWVPGNPEPGSGVHALTHLEDLSTVVVPDLYSPEPLSPVESIVDEIPGGSATFEPCLDRGPAVGDQEWATPALDGLALDPGLPADLERVTQLQARLVELAETLASFVVLLDAPPGLSHRKLLQWRSRIRSSYAAAYHPWLRTARIDDARDRLILLNPSASAAGIIARQENLFGVPHGPANVIVEGVVSVEEVVSPRQHAELHTQGVNVFLRERDGVRLTAGRTLSREPAWRQLTVRRLILMLRRLLEQQMHWMVFEPNGPALWSDVRRMLQTYLRQLYVAGAFAGATEKEAFFVRCDEVLNPAGSIDSGRLVAEVGVAPSEPIEFIVLRITRGGDGTLSVEG